MLSHLVVTVAITSEIHALGNSTLLALDVEGRILFSVWVRVYGPSTMDLSKCAGFLRNTGLNGARRELSQCSLAIGAI